MVLSPTVQRPRRASPSVAARSIAAIVGTVEGGGVVRPRGGFQEGRAVERTRRAPDRGDESVPDGPQQLPGERLVRELRQQRVHRPKADHEVVAVIAVTEDRVEAGEVGGVPLDDDPASPQRRAQRGGIDRGRDRVGGGGWGAHGRTSLGGASLCGNGPRSRLATPATLHRIS